MTTDDASSNTNELQITLTHHGAPHTFTFPANATISDLSTRVTSALSIPPFNQKFLITPKTGLLRPPFKDPTLPLSSLVAKKIVLTGSTAVEISTLQDAVMKASTPRTYGGIRPASPARTLDHRKAQEEALYTFHTLRPLPYLPGPERSLRFLERLRDDPGIKASMRKHKFSVPLLTEMDPAQHTTHESRTLGLNRNRGEVIELRLRTDAYDGYRDYKTIRKTLCHEMAHNVWGEHDRNFWDLCHEIEKEVERNDWTRGGHSVGKAEFAPAAGVDEDFVDDHGGWTGGEFVLGSGGSTGRETVISSAGGQVNAGGLSRREVLARAAEERMKAARRAGGQDGAGGEKRS